MTKAERSIGECGLVRRLERVLALAVAGCAWVGAETPSPVRYLFRVR